MISEYEIDELRLATFSARWDKKLLKKIPQNLILCYNFAINNKDNLLIFRF